MSSLWITPRNPLRIEDSAAGPILGDVFFSLISHATDHPVERVVDKKRRYRKVNLSRGPYVRLLGS